MNLRHHVNLICREILSIPTKYSTLAVNVSVISWFLFVNKQATNIEKVSLTYFVRVSRHYPFLRIKTMQLLMEGRVAARHPNLNGLVSYS